MKDASVLKTLFIIDPQNDFLGLDDGAPLVEGGNSASLPVKGAVADMLRLAGYIDRQGREFGEIIITLDTHEVVGSHLSDIGHPEFWLDAVGEHPAPFTLITKADVASRVWRPYIEIFGARIHDYFEKVGSQMVWPRHCIDGTWGHQVFTTLRGALGRWEEATGKKVMYVRKGMNPFTEQYGVFEAEAPDPDDKTTQFNVKLLAQLATASHVVVAGEALDYCVKTSVSQAAAVLPVDALHKFSLLADCMSPVNTDGKNTAGLAFLNDMQNRGMCIVRT